MKTMKMTNFHNIPKIEINCVNLHVIALSSQTQNCDIHSFLTVSSLTCFLKNIIEKKNKSSS